MQIITASLIHYFEHLFGSTKHETAKPVAAQRQRGRHDVLQLQLTANNYNHLTVKTNIHLLAGLFCYPAEKTINCSIRRFAFSVKS